MVPAWFGLKFCILSLREPVNGPHLGRKDAQINFHEFGELETLPHGSGFACRRSKKKRIKRKSKKEIL